MFNGPLSEPEVLADVSRSAAEHGLDFSLLHPEAVSAQVRSRAHDCGISVAEYLGTLRGARLEMETLLRAIVNTRGLFYQDPDGWEYLEHHLRKQWRDVSSEVQIRAWVPNCGSGQDAYTLAMVLAQALGNPEGLARRVQIIATNLDEYAPERAVRRALRGTESGVRPPRLAAVHAERTGSGSGGELGPSRQPQTCDAEIGLAGE